MSKRNSPSNSKTSPAGNGRKRLYSAFVGNLPVNSTKSHLRDLFEGCGHVEELFIAECTSEKSYTYGFVRFLTMEACTKAVTELNGWPLQGRVIRVEFAKLTIVDRMDTWGQCKTEEGNKKQNTKLAKSKKNSAENSANLQRLRKAYSEMCTNGDFPVIDVVDLIEALDLVECSLVQPVIHTSDAVTIDVGKYSDILKNGVNLLKPAASDYVQKGSTNFKDATDCELLVTAGNVHSSNSSVQDHTNKRRSSLHSISSGDGESINKLERNCSGPATNETAEEYPRPLDVLPPKLSPQILSFQSPHGTETSFNCSVRKELDPDEHSVTFWNNLNFNNSNNSRRQMNSDVNAKPRILLSDVRYKMPEVDGRPDVRYCNTEVLHPKCHLESVHPEKQCDASLSTVAQDKVSMRSYIKKVMFGRGKQISTSPPSSPGGLQNTDEVPSN